MQTLAAAWCLLTPVLAPIVAFEIALAVYVEQGSGGSLTAVEVFTPLIVWCWWVMTFLPKPSRCDCIYLGEEFIFLLILLLHSEKHSKKCLLHLFFFTFGFGKHALFFSTSIMFFVCSVSKCRLASEKRIIFDVFAHTTKPIRAVAG